MHPNLLTPILPVPVDTLCRQSKRPTGIETRSRTSLSKSTTSFKTYAHLSRLVYNYIMKL